MKKVKFALLGASKISSQHLKAINSLSSHCDLVDVCDINQNALNEISKTTEANLHKDYEEMLSKTDADCICITTPSGIHHSHALKAGKAGFDVLVEKPIATSLTHAKSLISYFKKYKKRLFAVKQVRFIESIKILRKALAEERFGKVHLINMNIFLTRPQDYYDSAEWRGTYKFDGGGVLMNQAIHYFDLMQLIGGKPKEIISFNETLSRNIEVEDCSVSIIKFKNSSIGSLNASVLAYPRNLETSITVLGEKGTVKIGGKNLNSFQEWNFKTKRKDDPVLNKDLTFKSGHTFLYEDIISVYKNKKKKPEVDGEEALKSLKLVLSSYNSSANKSPVRFK